VTGQQLREAFPFGTGPDTSDGTATASWRWSFRKDDAKPWESRKFCRRRVAGRGHEIRGASHRPDFAASGLDHVIVLNEASLYGT